MTDRQTDGRTDRRTDGWTDRQAGTGRALVSCQMEIHVGQKSFLLDNKIYHLKNLVSPQLGYTSGLETMGKASSMGDKAQTIYQYQLTMVDLRRM